MRSKSDDADRWLLENECDGVVAVVFASCPYSTPTCNANALTATGWIYEPAGILMTTPEQRLVRERLVANGPSISAVYALRAPGEPRRIRYLACTVSDPVLLNILSERSESPANDSERRLRAAAQDDPCYARVLAFSQAGQSSSKSPDALLRSGI